MVDTYSVNAKKNKLYFASPIPLAPPFTLTNTVHASLTEEYPQRDVITSELGTCVLLMDLQNHTKEEKHTKIDTSVRIM